MNFLSLLKSLDDLLYEVTSWLVVYPITLWRALTRALAMMRYADAELKDAPEQQYADVPSPSLFLLITVILSHFIEIAVIGDSPLIASTRDLAGLITDDTSLIALRMVASATFPLALMFSVGTTLGQCLPQGARLAGALLALGAVAWFLVLETLWFGSLLRCGWWRAVGNAGRAYAEGGCC